MEVTSKFSSYSKFAKVQFVKRIRNGGSLKEVKNMPDKIIKGEGLWNGRLLKFNTLESTNVWAVQHIDFCQNGDVIWAVRQTMGKGRLSRVWLSPDDKGLTLSVVVEFKDNRIIPAVNFAAALAVNKTLEMFSLKGNLKWPNDVLVRGRKIAGILSEAKPERNFVVVGIGLNVNMKKSDIESANFSFPATSMLIEIGRPLEMDILRKVLVSSLEKNIDSLFIHGTKVVIDSWEKYDWLSGSLIEIDTPAGVIKGTYNGMDEQGRLRLIDKNGCENLFWSGDVKKVVAVD